MATAKENDRMLPNESNIILKEDGKNELRISRVIQKIKSTNKAVCNWVCVKSDTNIV